MKFSTDLSCDPGWKKLLLFAQLPSYYPHANRYTHQTKVFDTCGSMRTSKGCIDEHLDVTAVPAPLCHCKFYMLFLDVSFLRVIMRFSCELVYFLFSGSSALRVTTVQKRYHVQNIFYYIIMFWRLPTILLLINQFWLIFKNMLINTNLCW